MSLSFLPKVIYEPLSLLDYNKLFQIRLRADSEISVIYNKKNYYLSNNGVEKSQNNALICTKEYVNQIIDNVTEKSIYAFNEKLVNGFLTVKNGIRIGVAGECVIDRGKIITIKNISSLNVRIPHEIENCSKAFYPKIYNKGYLYNTLIISAPFCGKTTILKDLVRKLNEKTNFSILIIDERDEFSTIKGKNIDIISLCDKQYGFNIGLRSLSPNVIICDELANENDWVYCNKAVLSGVKIIASCHANSIEDVFNKYAFKKGVFERYVLLNNSGFGKLKAVYDEELNLIWI